MRWLAATFVLILALPAALAAEPYLVLVEEQPGHALAPTSPLLSSPVAAVYVFDVPTCYRRMILDLTYEPDEAVVAAAGVGEAALAYEFRADVLRDGEIVLSKRITRSGHHQLLGELRDTGEHTLRLSLAWGADVAYTVRLRGGFETGNATCNPPLGPS